ncbi:MAG: hypothetical protein QG608_1614 [Actinomycetota bacterium]|nr:hypothetical protein [Actinomycetota bacterium]
MTVQTDQDLLAQVRSGDEAALRQLYQRHAPAVLRLGMRLSSSRTVAEEALQDTFLAVWQAAGTFQGRSSVKGWILGITRRKIHDRMRGKHATLLPVEEAHGVPDPSPGPETDVINRAGAAALQAQIEGLPEHLRTTLALVTVEELPYTEVAQVLGIPIGTVKSRMSTVRKLLATRLLTDQATS